MRLAPVFGALEERQMRKAFTALMATLTIAGTLAVTMADAEAQCVAAAIVAARLPPA